MEYVYYQRGKCSNCNNIVWTTGAYQSVICPCGSNGIYEGQVQNLQAVTDQEHEDAIRSDLGINEEITLVDGGSGL